MSDEMISIVGGGCSVRDVELLKIPGTIIAINDSAVHLPHFDIAVSMDRLWTEYRYDWMRKQQKPAWIRRSALKKFPDKWPWLNSFECDHTSSEFSDQPGVLNGTNSGLCAINLAYQMKPAKILLFGFDMKRSREAVYWHEPYPWRPNGGTTSGKYAEWSKQFRCAARVCAVAGIDVAVIGDSAIEGFRKIPSSEFMRIAA